MRTVSCARYSEHRARKRFIFSMGTSDAFAWMVQSRSASRRKTLKVSAAPRTTECSNGNRDQVRIGVIFKRFEDFRKVLVGFPGLFLTSYPFCNWYILQLARRLRQYRFSTHWADLEALTEVTDSTHSREKAPRFGLSGEAQCVPTAFCFQQGISLHLAV